MRTSLTVRLASSLRLDAERVSLRWIVSLRELCKRNFGRREKNRKFKKCRKISKPGSSKKIGQPREVRLPEFIRFCLCVYFVSTLTMQASSSLTTLHPSDPRKLPCHNKPIWRTWYDSGTSRSVRSTLPERKACRVSNVGNASVHPRILSCARR